MRPRYRFIQLMDRWSSLVNARWPRGIGTAGTVAVILASLAYGSVKGDHIPTVVEAFKDVLAAAGVTDTTSLLFLDVEQTRERLKSNPWIADATVLKLYPGELQIGIREREAFALWQKNGRVSVIADD